MVLHLVNYNNPGLRSLTLNFFHVKNNKNTVENNNDSGEKKNHIVTYAHSVYLHCLMWLFIYQCDLPLSLCANIRPTQTHCTLKRSGRLTRSPTPSLQCPTAMTSPLSLNWMPPPYSGQTAWFPG